MIRNFSHALFYSAATVLAVLQGCTDSADTEIDAAPRIRPVKVFTVNDALGGSTRSFPARIEAAREAQLSFRISGTVQEVLVKESESVVAGQVLARLDPTDVKLVLDDRQATFDNASRNFERGKELVVAGNISRTDFDKMESTYRSAEAALSAAKQNVAYTELKAPFAGRIATRLVENFEEVNAKQPVLTLQQLDGLEVVINVPESFLRQLRVSVGALNVADDEARPARSWATFDGVPGERFPLTLKEASTKADSQTQTFAVTYTMKTPESFVVLPGMTAQVTVQLPDYMLDSQAIMIPSTAVVADAGLKPYVWVIDPETMTVSKRTVTVGNMSGRLIEVLSGLRPDDEIVAVGAAFLAEGTEVKRLPQDEQAAPRPQDPA